jgi:hypothetical protein
VPSGCGGAVRVAAAPSHADLELLIADRDDDAVLRYDGETGASIDVFIPIGSGGLSNPRGFVFRGIALRPADFNGDQVVIGMDLLALLDAWGESGVPQDVNDDGIVNVMDRLELLAAWGPAAETTTSQEPRQDQPR